MKGDTMLNWLKSILKKDIPMGASPGNKYFIEKYKDFDKIIATSY